MLVRYEPIDLKATDAAGFYPIYRPQKPFELNCLMLIAGGLVVVQLWKSLDGTGKVTGALPLNANTQGPFFFLPPGYGIPIETGELVLQKSAAQAIGGFFGYTLLSGGAPAIEDQTDVERLLRESRRSLGVAR